MKRNTWRIFGSGSYLGITGRRFGTRLNYQAAQVDQLIQGILAYEPTAYWPLNDPVGSAAARDVTGNGFTGTVVGNVTFGNAGLTSYGETAAGFDGSTSSHILVPTPITTPFTIMALTTNAGTVANNTYFSNGTTATAGFRSSHDAVTAYDTLMQVAPSDLYATAPGAAGTTLSVTAADGSLIYASQNGSAYATNGSSLSLSSVSGIGLKGNIVGLTNDFSGTIAHVAIFPYVLTPQQVSDIYALVTGTPAPGTNAYQDAAVGFKPQARGRIFNTASNILTTQYYYLAAGTTTVPGQTAFGQGGNPPDTSLLLGGPPNYNNLTPNGFIYAPYPIDGWILDNTGGFGKAFIYAR